MRNDSSSVQGSIPSTRHRFLRVAVGFESLLGAVAIALSWLTGLWSFQDAADWFDTFVSSSTGEHLFWGCGLGLLATIPMMLCMALIERYPLGPLQSLRDIAEHQIVPMFSEINVLGFAAISVSAGVGEELLFRWFLQQGMETWIGPPVGWIVGLVVASIVFGFCHWLNATYAILTCFIGIYLGALLIVTGNLLVPIVAHGFYDFVALVYLRHRFHTDQPRIETV